MIAHHRKIPWILKLEFCFLLKNPSMSSLQAISRLCDDKYKDVRRAARKRSASMDNLCGVRWVPAILS